MEPDSKRRIAFSVVAAAATAAFARLHIPNLLPDNRRRGSYDDHTNDQIYHNRLPAFRESRPMRPLSSSLSL